MCCVLSAARLAVNVYCMFKFGIVKPTNSGQCTHRIGKVRQNRPTVWPAHALQHTATLPYHNARSATNCNTSSPQCTLLRPAASPLGLRSKVWLCPKQGRTWGISAVQTSDQQSSHTAKELTGVWGGPHLCGCPQKLPLAHNLLRHLHGQGIC